MLCRGVDAVTAALEYRIAVVQAPAGWGKTTAVRAALAEVPHMWRDAATMNLEEPASPGSLVVVDDLQAAPGGAAGVCAIAAMADRFTSTRWVFVSRQPAGLPISAWIARGEAGAPVGLRDLSLSAREIRQAAKSRGLRVDEAAMRFLAGVAGGWPVAVTFALSALERSPSDLPRAAATTQRLLSAYVAADMFAGLDDDRLDLLSQCALLGAFDEALLTAVGREEASADLQWLAGAAVPFYEEKNRVSLHPAFAPFAIARIPAKERRSRALGAAAALRAAGLIGRAFDLVREHAPDAALAQLRQEGLALLDAGCWDGVEGAVRALPHAMRRDDPIVLCIRADLEAHAGAPLRANLLYERATNRASSPAVGAAVGRRRALHYLNQGKAEALDAIRPALDVGSDIERTDARGIYAMTLAFAGDFDAARREGLRAVASATELDDEALLARSMHRMSYVEYQTGNIPDAEKHAREAARLAERAGAWFHFFCAQTILYSTAVGARDDHDAALRHARRMARAAERMGNRRQRLFALGAEYILEVERGRRERALAIESEMSPRAIREQLDCLVAFATRLSWDGDFSKGYRSLAMLDDRVLDASERRHWNAALAMFAAFAGEERNASLRLRACGTVSSSGALENAMSNVIADCFAALAQIVLGHAGAAVRRLPRDAPTSQTRALASFARDLAALGPSLGTGTAARALQRLRAEHQEGLADAVAAALAARYDGSGTTLTQAETRVLAELARGRSAKAIAEKHARSIHTIRNQIKAAMRKLGASGSLEAIARARRLGLLR